MIPNTETIDTRPLAITASATHSHFRKVSWGAIFAGMAATTSIKPR